MNRQYIYSIASLTKKHGQREVLSNIWLAFYPHAKIGVLGRNGAGKVHAACASWRVRTRSFDGEARLTPGFTSGYLPQEPLLDAGQTVRENVDAAVAPRRPSWIATTKSISQSGRTDETREEMEKLCDELARVQDQIDAGNLWELDREIEIAMDAINLPPGDADVTTLSGGERRRVALCQILLRQPDLLLLDEPTNHLDADAVAWLERHLAEYPGTVVAVTHDRYFLDNVAGWILELDRGRGHSLGGQLLVLAGTKAGPPGAGGEIGDRAPQKTLQRELEWVRMAPRARQAKNKARLECLRRTVAARIRGAAGRIGNPDPARQAPGRSGHRTADMSPSRTASGCLMEDLSFRLPAGGIVGVIGPNGAGKTTLFRMLTGEEEPDAGVMRVGPTVELGYVDQNRDALVADHTVYEEISGGHDTLVMGGRKINARAYVSRFNFRGPDQEKKVGTLSGGERNRVHLAKLLRRGCNVLLLDEPTNDLDVDTLRALEEAILNFAGCVVVISPRSLVSGSDRHAHPVLRGRRLRPLVRGKLPNLRTTAARTPGHCRRVAAPLSIQEITTLIAARHVGSCASLLPPANTPSLAACWQHCSQESLHVSQASWVDGTIRGGLGEGLR